MGRTFNATESRHLNQRTLTVGSGTSARATPSYSTNPKLLSVEAEDSRSRNFPKLQGLAGIARRTDQANSFLPVCNFSPLKSKILLDQGTTLLLPMLTEESGRYTTLDVCRWRDVIGRGERLENFQRCTEAIATNLKISVVEGTKDPTDSRKSHRAGQLGALSCRTRRRALPFTSWSSPRALKVIQVQDPCRAESTMERLLDQADALLLTARDDGPERPDFDIPVELAHLAAPYDLLELLEHPTKGKGWFAKQSLKAGTVVMIGKPIAWAMDCEAMLDEDSEDAEVLMEDDDDDGSENDKILDSEVNELVILETIQRIKNNPSVWLEQVSGLYPRENAGSLPAWRCKNQNILSKFQAAIQDLEKIPELRGQTKEIAVRLPLIIRYNTLSVETCPELLSFPGPTGHSLLSGAGLYHLPSLFNHDPRPNISRYAVGDIMWFVTNQDVQQGQELCLSYLEHDVLCETSSRQNCLLTFDIGEAANEADVLDDGPISPVVDSEVQMELMEMIPFERLDAIDELTMQATGEALPEGERTEEDGMDASGTAWFQCDVQNLRVLKAITLESLGQSQKALDIWEECVDFAETCLPPNDESSIVVRVQAALCAWQVQDKDRAREHASVALNVHNLMFGGGVPRFRRRYLKEFCLNLRKSKGDPAEKVLWPYDQ
eukprot:scaffold1157_cov122-Cylindrotheca_fusiformis.AAC.23